MSRCNFSLMFYIFIHMVFHRPKSGVSWNRLKKRQIRQLNFIIGVIWIMVEYEFFSL